MKTLYLFAFFILSSNLLKAQDWAPVGTEWYYTHVYFWTADIDFNHWVSVKDTTVNDHNCRIIEKTRLSCDLRPEREFMYGENRRIYFFNKKTDHFEVFYDFNLEAGDSLVVPLWLDNNWGNEPDSLVYIIDSVSTYAWGDSTYAKQYISYGEHDYVRHFTAIENIGGTFQMFNYAPGLCDGEYDIQLRCYNSETTGLINFGSIACDFTPVEDLNINNKIRLFPNPFEDVLNIEVEVTNLDNLSFKVYNYTGKTLFDGKLNSTKQELDVSRYAPGIYFVQLFKSGKPLLVEKVIKM